MPSHGNYCCADLCKVNSVKDKNVSFFRFPKDPVRCQQWKDHLGFIGEHKYASLTAEQAYKSVKICSTHFNGESFVYEKHLKKTAVPSKLLPESLDMPTLRCVVSGCSNTNFNSDVMLFKFSKNADRSKMWAIACSRKDLVANCAKLHCSGSRVCARHFEPCMFTSGLRNRLRASSIPTIFPQQKDTADDEGMHIMDCDEQCDETKDHSSLHSQPSSSQTVQTRQNISQSTPRKRKLQQSLGISRTKVARLEDRVKELEEQLEAAKTSQNATVNDVDALITKFCPEELAKFIRIQMKKQGETVVDYKQVQNQVTDSSRQATSKSNAITEHIHHRPSGLKNMEDFSKEYKNFLTTTTKDMKCTRHNENRSRSKVNSNLHRNIEETNPCKSSEQSKAESDIDFVDLEKNERQNMDCISNASLEVDDDSADWHQTKPVLPDVKIEKTHDTDEIATDEPLETKTVLPFETAWINNTEEMAQDENNISETKLTLQSDTVLCKDNVETTSDSSSGATSPHSRTKKLS